MKNKHLQRAFATFQNALDGTYRPAWHATIASIKGVGPATFNKIFEYFPDRTKMLTCAGRHAEDIQNLFRVLDGIKRNQNQAEICLKLFQSWYFDFLTVTEKEACTRLFRSLEPLFRGIHIVDAIADFQLMDETTKEETKKDTTPKVVITTIHQAKGLEWDIVVVGNLNDAGLPWKLAKTQEDIEEECRALYVAVTRAKTELFLTATLSTKQDYGEDYANDEDDAKGKVSADSFTVGSPARLSRFLENDVLKFVKVSYK